VEAARRPGITRARAEPYSFIISDERSVAGKGYGDTVQVEPNRDRQARIARLDPHNENVDTRLNAPDSALATGPQTSNLARFQMGQTPDF